MKVFDARRSDFQIFDHVYERNCFWRTWKGGKSKFPSAFSNLQHSWKHPCYNEVFEGRRLLHRWRNRFSGGLSHGRVHSSTVGSSFSRLKHEAAPIKAKIAYRESFWHPDIELQSKLEEIHENQQKHPKPRLIIMWLPVFGPLEEALQGRKLRLNEEVELVMPNWFATQPSTALTTASENSQKALQNVFQYKETTQKIKKKKCFEIFCTEKNH